jgi:predicted membrane protein
MNRSRTWTGVLLIAVGLLFLFDSMGMMDFGDAMRTYWPLILIFFGLRSILRPSRRMPEYPTTGSEPQEARGFSSETIYQSTVFGNLSIRVDSRSFTGGSASTVFGNLGVDLSPSGLREGQSLLRLSGVFGSVHVRVPEGMEYAASLTTLIGGVSAGDQRQGGFSAGLRYQTPGYTSATRRLMITASQVIGDITVSPL